MGTTSFLKHLIYATLFASLLSPLLGMGQQKIASAAISFEFVDKGVKGTISGFESQSVLDRDNLEASVLEGTVATETLDTNNGLRNWSLKSGKYFDKSDYPKIHYKSSTIAKNGDSYAVDGILTLKGVSKPLSIVFSSEGKKLIGTATLYTSDFGIKIKKKREDNKVNVRFEFQLE